MQGNLVRKRKLWGSAHRSAAEVDYLEMQYWTFGTERTEGGFRKEARELWWLTRDASAIEVMRVQYGNVTFHRLKRVGRAAEQCLRQGWRQVGDPDARVAPLISL